MSQTGKTGNRDSNNYSLYLLIALVVAASFALWYLYHVGGPSWDYIVHYLNGKSLTNPILYHSKNVILSEVTLQGKNVYYEAYRAPLAVFLFGLLALFDGKPLFLYAIVVWIIFLLAIYKFKKDMKLDALITYAVMLSPYIIAITFFLSSEEILSIIFAMLSVGLLIKEDSAAGATLGIASLAKYPSLILLPAVLLLRKPKKIAKGILLEILVMILWFVFNVIITGNPFTSIIESYSTVLGNAPPSPIYLATILTVFLYPAILAAVYVLIFIKIRLDKKKIASPLAPKNFDHTKLVLVVFFGLSLLQWLLVVGHYDPIAQSRYAYLIALMSLVVVAYLLSEVQKFFKYTKYIVFVVSLIGLAVLVYGLHSSAGALAYYNPNLNQSVFHVALNKIDALGYGNCRVISNAWPYMRYLGLNVYMPFYENSTMSRYPILLFTRVGVNATPLLYNLNQTKLVYNDSNFSIRVPYNFSCYTN